MAAKKNKYLGRPNEIFLPSSLQSLDIFTCRIRGHNTLKSSFWISLILFQYEYVMEKVAMRSKVSYSKFEGPQAWTTSLMLMLFWSVPNTNNSAPTPFKSSLKYVHCISCLRLDSIGFTITK